MFSFVFGSKRSPKFIFITLIRSKSTNVHFYKGKNKLISTDLTLRHFDNFYAKIYGNQWQSIRLGLLSPKKYAAIVNNFVDFHSVEIELRKMGAYNLRHIYMKNLQKIAKRLKHYEFLKSRLASNDKSGDVYISPLELEECSESESETIENFFTNAEESELENNAATFNLNLDEFVPVSELKYQENLEDDTDYFKFYDINFEVSVSYTKQNSLEIPQFLNLYIFGRNDFSVFPAAKLENSNLLNYYLIDCASALPVLVMDVQENDYVADFCAAPGGKALLLIYLMKNCRLFLNDVSASRFQRLRNVFFSFVPKNVHQNIIFSNCDVNNLKKYEEFDKILVDVPCTNDRHSLFVNENNIFSPKRLKERINIPTKQLEILFEALKSVKNGGSVVYSTCSLSPIQNDGVVHMALKKIQQSTSLDFSVVDLKEALRPLRTTFKLNFQFKYGVQVVPHLPCNFGPMYFCKLVRNN